MDSGRFGGAAEKAIQSQPKHNSRTSHRRISSRSEFIALLGCASNQLLKSRVVGSESASVQEKHVEGKLYFKMQRLLPDQPTARRPSLRRLWKSSNRQSDDVSTPPVNYKKTRFSGQTLMSQYRSGLHQTLAVFLI